MGSPIISGKIDVEFTTERFIPRDETIVTAQITLYPPIADRLNHAMGIFQKLVPGEWRLIGTGSKPLGESGTEAQIFTGEITVSDVAESGGLATRVKAAKAEEGVEIKIDSVNNRVSSQSMENALSEMRAEIYEIVKAELERINTAFDNQYSYGSIRFNENSRGMSSESVYAASPKAALMSAAPRTSSFEVRQHGRENSPVAFTCEGGDFDDAEIGSGTPPVSGQTVAKTELIATVSFVTITED